MKITDKMRLDFYERSMRGQTTHTVEADVNDYEQGGLVFDLWKQPTGEGDKLKHIGEYDTLREAIDAAIRAEKAVKQ